ncbi:MAG TPA: DUF1648 domain-containing protein [Candidatus Eremiobacteraceae bacterium]|nr:DUF1648 domain-containing protein [Candidatus Eremiobacteraceae bacterium]
MPASVVVDSICELIGFGATVFIVGLTVVSYGRLPALIANHFNLRGEPTQWSPRALAWLTPVLSVAFFVLQTALNPSIAPYFPGSPDAPTEFWMPVPLTAAILVMTLIQREILTVALGAPRADVRQFIFAMGLLLVAVGFVFVQATSSAIRSR